jgi:hypothetical protein
VDRRPGRGAPADPGAARRNPSGSRADPGTDLPATAKHRRHPPQGHHKRRYWKGHYLRDFGDDAIGAFVSCGARDGDDETDPALLASGDLQAYGGAIGSVGPGETAFSHRDALIEFVARAGWTDPAEDQARISIARRYGAAIEPYASGAYVNDLTDEGQEGVRRAYGAGQMARLTALKEHYDPHNIFHLNHNIPPGQPTAAPCDQHAAVTRVEHEGGNTPAAARP